MPRTPEYIVWNNMLSRCFTKTAPNYQRYGGRGITVCERWRHSFAAFLADVGPRPSGYQLERSDNDGDYEPGNAAWAARSVQMRNKRNNVYLTAFGRTQCFKDWAVEFGMAQNTLRWRLEHGMSVEAALTTPRAPAARDPLTGRLITNLSCRAPDVLTVQYAED